MNITTINVRIILTAVFIVSATFAFGQITPIKNQYFETPVLINPAQAGAEKQGSASVIYSAQWDKMEGAPKIMSAVIQSPITEKMGLGITLVNDKAGFISRTTGFGSYSYKAKFNDVTAIRFGISAGFLVDKANIPAAETPNRDVDAALSRYNSKQEVLFKGGAGALFTSGRFDAQLSWHDLTRRPLNEIKTVDHPGFTASLSYKIAYMDSCQFRPVAGIRQIKGLKNYFDLGFNTSYRDAIDLTAIYHTNKTFTGGVGYQYRDRMRFVFLYSTASMGGLTGGSYEASLMIPFTIKKPL